MAIRGTLEHMGIASVLQLIAQNARHGVLTIDHGASQANLFFVGGQLVRVDGTEDNKEDNVGLRLAAAGLMDPAALQALMVSHPGRVVPALVAEAQLDAATVALYAGLHSTETVHRAMGWSVGSYAFLPASAPPVPSHPGQRADHLLMDALRAQDGWPALRQVVPHNSGVYSVSRSLEDYLVTQAMTSQTSVKDDFADGFGFDDLSGEGASAHAATELSHNDRLIYSLIDGQRTLQEVIDRSALTTFDATSSLVALINAQLVVQTQRMAAPESTRATQVVHVASQKLIWRLHDAAPWALRMAYAAAGVAALCHHGLGRPHEAQRLAWQQQAPAVQQALEVVHAKTGTYPKECPTSAAGTHDVAPLYAPAGVGYQLRWRADP